MKAVSIKRLIFALAAVFLSAALCWAAEPQEAVFAGGCFWGIEGLYEHVHGVLSAESGYSGGTVPNPNYRAVSSGSTGHAEAVRIVFDPDLISYQKLLQVFFSVAHDPTTLNYQIPDRGSQYRSAIFYGDERQRSAALQAISEAAADFSRPIVTEVVPLEAFYPAEDYHQDFMRKFPEYPYVVRWDWPKIQHLQEAFPDVYVDRDWR